MESATGPIPNQRAVRAFERYACGAGAAAVLIGVLVLLGWVLDNSWLISVVPGAARMKANTAIGFILAGLALLSLRSGVAPALRPSNLFSLLLLLLSSVTIYQMVADVDLGIDTLLFADDEALEHGRTPGRMSQLTAAALLLLGLLGLSDARPAANWSTQLLALAVLALSLFALGSFAYSLGGGNVLVHFDPVAVHSGLCLLLLALGWLAARPEVGMMRTVSADSLGGALARRTLLPALFIPSLLSYLAQVVQSHGWLSSAGTVVILAVSSGLAVALMIWWVGSLLDRVERQRRLAHELRDNADSDALTGLGNRRLFDRTLSGLLQGRRERDLHFSLLMLDLDRFKDYNDAFGHLAGDEALRLTGRILLHALRPGDVATRYGGEEFAVLLPGIDAGRAALVAERICADFRAQRWPNKPVTVSIGVTDAIPEDRSDDLIGRADAALYAAKQAGRDQVAILLPSLKAASMS